MLGDRSVAGERCVIAFSAQACGLVEESFTSFSRGLLVTVEGYLGTLPPEIVMQRARCSGAKPSTASMGLPRRHLEYADIGSSQLAWLQSLRQYGRARALSQWQLHFQVSASVGSWSNLTRAIPSTHSFRASCSGEHLDGQPSASWSQQRSDPFPAKTCVDSAK